MKRRRNRMATALIVTGVFALLLSTYAFLWAISAFNLAFADCHGTFSIAEENIRCQRPVWLGYVFQFFGVLGLGLVVLAFVVRRQDRTDD